MALGDAESRTEARLRAVRPPQTLWHSLVMYFLHQLCPDGIRNFIAKKPDDEEVDLGRQDAV
jgi:hypothetical protein